MSKNKNMHLVIIRVQGCLENLVENMVFKMMLLKSPLASFKTTNNVSQWQYRNYFEHTNGPTWCDIFL